MFLLAHISDVHLAPLPSPALGDLMSKRGLGYLNWLRKRRAIHRPEVLAAIVTDLNAQQPDHVAVTGDLVNLSLSNEFGPARAWLDAFGSPHETTFVPGNHDAYVRAAAGRAAQDWGDYMRGDAGETFPFVRRRGKVALIGLSTSLPTLPLAATGRLGNEQLARLGDALAALKKEELFRVILIHHPPIPGVSRFRRLHDAAELRQVLRKHGAELLLHGHLHESSLIWISGPRESIPCIGAPSASGSPHYNDDPAGYNLLEIDGEPGDWHCQVIARGMSREDGTIGEVSRQMLTG
ncbi:MAG: metallophosphoesterase [Xanthobacteraceae bacterium]|jgi:3',5'-cyclic AMP phosphodiesterase CpdA